MEALPDLPSVRVTRLANGKLVIHEELPEVVASAIRVPLAAAEEETKTG